MRELERDDLPSTLSARLAVVGRGRVGGSLAAAAERVGLDVSLVSSDAVDAIPGGSAVLLCVPDEAIAAAADALTQVTPAIVGHTSGATTLDALAPAAKHGAGTYSLHPLQTFADAATEVQGTPAATARTSIDRACICAARSDQSPWTKVPETFRALKMSGK